MSLVSTYVRMADGRWHQNPVLGEADWFICFDDDEPPELVIKKSAYALGLTPQAIFKKTGIKATVYSERSGCSRMFNSRRKYKFIPAVAFFITLNAAPPVTCLLDEDRVFKCKPGCSGVYYAW